MPKPLRMSRRTWVAAWVVLCGAGIAATAALNAFPAPDPQPEKPGSAEYIADTEAQLAKAKVEGNEDGVLALSLTRVGADDCSDEILDHFSGDR
ncbi:hypothetical protein ACIHJG_40170 [Streptomyces sp. NPDC052415]|uniref:hypothetical protein n=1 Tax=Streptomyces sp. NPDC052415 TaxID=3365690 RepID=UPI0037D6B48D